MSNLDVLVKTLPTPNPSAFKFVLNHPVKVEGKAQFDLENTPTGIFLVDELFKLGGIEKVYLFENIITITFAENVDLDESSKNIKSVLVSRIHMHDPHFLLESEIKRDRSTLPKEIQEIEAILDRTIRPALQGDGGDLEVLSYQDNVVEVKYQGACGSCPSSLYGTLEAIRGILQDEFNPDVEVTVADSPLMGQTPPGYYPYY